MRRCGVFLARWNGSPATLRAQYIAFHMRCPVFLKKIIHFSSFVSACLFSWLTNLGLLPENIAKLHGSTGVRKFRFTHLPSLNTIHKIHFWIKFRFTKQNRKMPKALQRISKRGKMNSLELESVRGNARGKKAYIAYEMLYNAARSRMAEPFQRARKSPCSCITQT